MTRTVFSPPLSLLGSTFSSFKGRVKSGDFHFCISAPSLPSEREDKKRSHALSSPAMSRLLAPLLARQLGASAQQQAAGSWLAGVGGGGGGAGEMIASGSIGGGLFPSMSALMISPSFLPPAAHAALGQVRW